MAENDPDIEDSLTDGDADDSSGEENANDVTKLEWYQKGIFRYFKFTEDQEKAMPDGRTNVYPKCKVKSCSRAISGQIKNWPNFERHLKRHKNVFEKYQRRKQVEKAALAAGRKPMPEKRKHSVMKSPSSAFSAGKQLKLDGIFSVEKPLSHAEQKLVDSLAVDYVVSEMRPLETVRKFSFRKYSIGLKPRIRFMGYKRIRSLISKAYRAYYRKLLAQFAESESVCLTIDLWTAMRRAFMGVTAHWICEKTLRRKSASIACKRIIGRHTFDLLAKSMEEIIEYFKLQKKAKSIVTDNGSNFVKAFKHFATKKELAPISDSEYETDSDPEPPFDYGNDIPDLESSQMSCTGTLDTTIELAEEATTDTTNGSTQPSAGSIIEEHLDRLAKAAELARETERAYQVALRNERTNHSTLEEEEESSSDEDDQPEQQPEAEQLPEFTLPVHFRCLSHSFNLMGTTDVENILKGKPGSKSEHKKAFAKLSSFWTRINKSTLAAESAFKLFGRQLPSPVPTRWNSTFDCLSAFLKQDCEKMKILFGELKIKLLSDEDYIYLQEYLKVMKPISCYLDVLQGEKNCYLGCALPVLVKLKTKLNSLTLMTKQAETLRLGLLTQINKRFGDLFNRDDFVLAAATHPLFKLHWLQEDNAAYEKCMGLLESLLSSLSSSVSPPISQQPQQLTDDSPTEELLRFVPTQQPRILNELEEYLNDPRTDLEMLHKYPNIKKLFVRCNTPIPSSAPVERLFSIGTLVLTPRRNRLSDLYFEHCLLLKIFNSNPDF